MLIEVNVLRGCLDPGKGGLFDSFRRPDKRHNGAVVVAVAADIQQPHRIGSLDRLDNGFDHLGTATLAKVRDASTSGLPMNDPFYSRRYAGILYH